MGHKTTMMKFNEDDCHVEFYDEAEILKARFVYWPVQQVFHLDARPDTLEVGFALLGEWLEDEKLWRGEVADRYGGFPSGVVLPGRYDIETDALAVTMKGWIGAFAFVGKWRDQWGESVRLDPRAGADLQPEDYVFFIESHEALLGKAVRMHGAL